MTQQPSTSPEGLARAAMEREGLQMPFRGPGVSKAMHVRPSTNGNTDLVDAETGLIVSPCASPAIAERTKAFFAK